VGSAHTIEVNMIKTRFKIGEDIYFLNGGGIRKEEVEGIAIVVNSENITTINYLVRDDIIDNLCILEEHSFKSQKKLSQAILKIDL
jgi:hypothetical protein